MKIAIEGCAHGELDAIYTTLLELQRRESIRIDLLLICGDFQALRNEADLECLACPVKYRHLGTFCDYYAGRKQAPILTVFIGGNHESMGYMRELFYGGWVCENIYFLGYAGVVQVGGIRIGGVSGIYKPQDYSKGYFELPPYNPSTLRSAYHLREYDVLRMSLLKTPLDILLTHDWPQGIERYGDVASLVRRKPFFRDEIQRNDLGNPKTLPLLQALRPRYWFAAHLHVKFAALYEHGEVGTVDAEEGVQSEEAACSEDVQSQDGVQSQDVVQSQETIDANNTHATKTTTTTTTATKFLALDKCLPHRDFLQVIDLDTPNDKIQLEYDSEWLAVVRATAPYLPLFERPSSSSMPMVSALARMVEREQEWVRHAVPEGTAVPLNFQQTVPIQPMDGSLDASGFQATLRPHLDPQTQVFCDMLSIPVPFTKDTEL